MKTNNLIFILMIALCLTLCEWENCKHVHTEECGKNGVACQHECNIIQPRRDEHSEI